MSDTNISGNLPIHNLDGKSCVACNEKKKSEQAASVGDIMQMVSTELKKAGFTDSQVQKITSHEIINLAN